MVRKIQNSKQLKGKKSPKMIMQIMEKIIKMKFRFWIKSEESKKWKENQTKTNQNMSAQCPLKQTKRQLKLTIFHVESKEQRRVLQRV